MKKIVGFFFIVLTVMVAAGIIKIFDFDKKIQEKLDKKDEVQNTPVELQIEVVIAERDVINPYSDVTIYSPNELEYKSGAEVSLTSIGKNSDGKNVYVAKFSKIPEGEATRKVILKDKNSESKKEIEVKFKRNDNSIPVGYDSIDGWPESKYILNPTDKLIVVDKNNRLPEDFEPVNLVDLNKTYGIYTFNDAKLNSEAGKDLNRMWTDCGKSTGDYVTIASGYRSWIDQFKIYAGNVGVYGEADTNTFSAKPGHSEHQTGFTIDITNKDTSYALTDTFSETVSGKWMVENAYKYGFIQSYSKDISEESGIHYEPWHFRYIGIETAKNVHDSGMDFYEWEKTQN